MDGTQLQKVFQYEAELSKQQNALVDFSVTERAQRASTQTEPQNTTGTTKMPNGDTRNSTELDIIGPFTSGTAASLRAGIDRLSEIFTVIPTVEALGVTSSRLAEEQMLAPGTVSVNYRSFGDDSRFAIDTLNTLLCESNFDMDRVALLKETGTLFSLGVGESVKACNGKPLVIDFPREISLLRNAHGAEPTNAESGPPSPYLPLSLLDLNAFDSIPHYSQSQTPLSQEAQLMAISRLLHRYRTQFVAILASNALDKLFLAQYLHRACPDIRLIDLGGDLLVEREVDNVPFLGTLTVGAYPLVGASRESLYSKTAMVISDTASISYFNAVSFVLWDGTGAGPHLLNYRDPFADRLAPSQPPLWLTTVGRDGYYPLATAAPFPSKSTWQIPKIEHREEQSATTQASNQVSSPILSNDSGPENNKWQILESNDSKPRAIDPEKRQPLPLYAARSWMILCTLISLLCILHLTAILVATYESPATCDLALHDNSEPHRRSMYIHIGSSMLFCMSFVISFPLFETQRFFHLHGLNIAAAVIVLCLGSAVVAVTFTKTKDYLWRTPRGDSQEATEAGYAMYLWADLYLSFRILAWMAIPATLGAWFYLCHTEGLGPYGPLHRGLFFSFRCIHPDSGVSPVVPVELILAGWYVWAVCQTRRLRFSLDSRPKMPKKTGVAQEKLFFVSDEDLKECSSGAASCLYENMTCLLITRAVLRRFGIFNKTKIDPWLAWGYALAIIVFILLQPIKGLEHMLWKGGLVAYLGTPYEWYFTALFFPLMLIAVTGWLRMVFVWGALHRGLLEWLEYQPIRHAFDRLSAVGWMTLLSRGGKHEQWRDMARCTQAMRHILNDPEVTAAMWQRLDCQGPNNGNVTYDSTIGKMRKAQEGLNRDIASFEDKCPAPKYKIMDSIESRYAAFAEGLLSGLLIPYWRDQQIGMVEMDAGELATVDAAERTPEIKGREDDPQRDIKKNPAEPRYIQVAEEFLALRYFALIRAVLVNMRLLIVFVTTCFVLTITALNVYPFQPRIAIDWFFTGLLVSLGAGVVYVFAVMHRNPILSRITHTQRNKLGADFWVRILSFGTVPVLTWMAYQFPSVGNMIYKLIQPGTAVIR